MNAAAMDFRQDQALHRNDQSSSHLNPGYLLQSQQQNSHPHHSKAMNHPPDPFVDLDLWQNRDTFGRDLRNVNQLNSINESPVVRRRPRTPPVRPLDLPVPQFEIDENYVGVIPNTNRNSLVQNSKDLDLDTRINLLIKSKALSGMHPIFSELSESEDFSHSSDDSLSEFPSRSKRDRPKVSSHQEKPPCHESFDNPETPLSRPPSPFLSRATYLFWFNKAIELKQQAKAQEKALIEEATKKRLSKTNSAAKITNQESSQQDSNLFLKGLLDEVGKELKEAIREHFLNQIIESTAFNSLENWWETQKGLETSCKESPTTDENIEIKSMSSGCEQSANIPNENGISCQSQRSTSPEEPFPWQIMKQSGTKERIIATKNLSSNESKVLSNTTAQYSLAEDKESNNQKGDIDPQSKILVGKETLDVCDEVTVSKQDYQDGNQTSNATKTEDIGSNSQSKIEETVEIVEPLSEKLPILPSGGTVQLVEPDSESYKMSKTSVKEPKIIKNIDLKNNCSESTSGREHCNGSIETKEERLLSSTPGNIIKKPNEEGSSIQKEDILDKDKAIGIISPSHDS